MQDTTSKHISDYAITEHGIENSQYFQGHGIVGAYPAWKDCATGCGSTAYEALEDALEQLACHGWDVDAIPNNLDDTQPLEGILLEDESDEDLPEVDCDCFFYVSVDVM
jgi:hypothetical protein